MPRYTPAPLPPGGSPPNIRPKQQDQSDALTPFAAGLTLGQAVRDEHGREGVRAYIAALNPLLPRALIEQLAGKLGVETPPPVPPSMPQAAPPPPPPKPPPKEAPGIPPELLLQLLQGAGGGGGLDPSTLLKLLQK